MVTGLGSRRTVDKMNCWDSVDARVGLLLPSQTAISPRRSFRSFRQPAKHARQARAMSRGERELHCSTASRR